MEQQALHAASVKFALDLHPSATGDVMEGIRDQLNALLLRYSAHLEGVLVSYTNPKILSQQARIHPYFPYFHLDVSADCVLFKPRAGHVLDGKVHMVSHDFIGLLMLGLFNVSIGRQLIRADLSHDPIADCWQSEKHEKHRIAVGSAIRFKVDRVDDESEFFTLGGSLLASGTGEVGFVTAQASKKDRKRRRSEAAATDAPAAVQTAPAVQQTAAGPNSSAAREANVLASTSKAGKSQGSGADISSPKKKKRRKHQEADAQQSMPNGNVHHQSANTSTSGQTLHQNATAQHAQPAVNGAQTGAAAAHVPSSADGKHKPHKKRKGEIDKQAGQAALPPDPDQQQAKHKSHKKKKGQIDRPDQSAAAASGAAQNSVQLNISATSGRTTADGTDKKLSSKKSKKPKSVKGKDGQA